MSELLERVRTRWPGLSRLECAAWILIASLVLAGALVDPATAWQDPRFAVLSSYKAGHEVDPWGQPWRDDGSETLEDCIFVEHVWSSGPNGVDEGRWGDDIIVERETSDPQVQSIEKVQLWSGISPLLLWLAALGVAFLAAPWWRGPRRGLPRDLLRAGACAVVPAALCVGGVAWAMDPARPWVYSMEGIGGVLSFGPDPWTEEITNWLSFDLFTLSAGEERLEIPRWSLIALGLTLVCGFVSTWLRFGPRDLEPRRAPFGRAQKLTLTLAVHCALLAVALQPIACGLSDRLALHVGFQQGDLLDPWDEPWQRTYTDWNEWIYYSKGPNAIPEVGTGDDLYPSQPLPNKKVLVDGRPLPDLSYSPIACLVSYARPAFGLLAVLCVWFAFLPRALRGTRLGSRFRGFTLTASAPVLGALGASAWIALQPWAEALRPPQDTLLLPTEVAVVGTLLACALVASAGAWAASGAWLEATPTPAPTGSDLLETAPRSEPERPWSRPSEDPVPCVAGGA